MTKKLSSSDELAAGNAAFHLGASLNEVDHLKLSDDLAAEPLLHLGASVNEVDQLELGDDFAAETLSSTSAALRRN